VSPWQAARRFHHDGQTWDVEPAASAQTRTDTGGLVWFHCLDTSVAVLGRVPVLPLPVLSEEQLQAALVAALRGTRRPPAGDSGA
jgi:hypothetical protein